MKYSDEWVKELTVDDVPKAFRPLVEAIGIEAAFRLSEAYPGMPVYVPKPETLFEIKRNELIRRDVRTLGYRGCARKYGLTEVWIRQIVDHQKDERQIDMFASGE